MKNYCESVFQKKRTPTREVKVGHLGVGGANPIRIQSMTTSNTRDVEATIEQAVRLYHAGCEIVRVTVQGMKEAEACEGIKNGLLKRGLDIPLVADIHFFPPAALKVADFVDKVRVNPGNFVDKRASFKVIEYDDASYALELEKIEEKLAPLIEKCKKLKRSLRIGTNHGSLSDRIMNRYGDTPQGMVESALEFARVCRKYDYHELIFSMKASNPQVMILAYRLLAAEMRALGWDYPLHLGVTEAGLGEDGRIKSAMGIGSLLLDGLGDTIRVSLTEDPWHEIDPCQRLIRLTEEPCGTSPFEETFRKFNALQKRPVTLPKTLSLHRDGSVLLTVKEKTADLYRELGSDGLLGQPKLKISSVDALVVDDALADELKPLFAIGISHLSPLTLTQAKERRKLEKFAQSRIAELVVTAYDEDWTPLLTLQPALICFSPKDNRVHQTRRFFEWLQQNGLSIPVILHFTYDLAPEDLTLQASMEAGSLLCDGLGEGLWLEGPYGLDFLRTLSFGILQAARMRTFKTDFISCPSCGRTLFDLQDVTKRIRDRTSHLPGVKIAIMGCIVNGPGEMADADFGYVGSKPGKIDLYVGKSCVEKDIDFADADDRLIELIKKHDRWVEV